MCEEECALRKSCLFKAVFEAPDLGTPFMCSAAGYTRVPNINRTTVEELVATRRSGLLVIAREDQYAMVVLINTPIDEKCLAVPFSHSLTEGSQKITTNVFLLDNTGGEQLMYPVYHKHERTEGTECERPRNAWFLYVPQMSLHASYTRILCHSYGIVINTCERNSIGQLEEIFDCDDD